MNGGGGGGGGNAHRNFDSNGPDVKIRGTASHIFERYCQLARDANASGDRVGAENFLQHAEHYYRIMLAQGITPGQRQANNGGNGQPGTQPQPAQPAAAAQNQPYGEDEPQPSLEMELEAALETTPEQRDEAVAG
ncbi:DUF4167 domain-containing protein [Ferrovibrio sp.]|nr:DUF4167 domain-containing protein [Ferrovibrio sp.]MBX3455734.1 DUF4167 domain-containing protein [Ferrovibrio sp.]